MEPSNLESLYLSVLDCDEWDDLKDWNKGTYKLLNDILKEEGISWFDRRFIIKTLKARQKVLRKEQQ